MTCPGAECRSADKGEEDNRDEGDRDDPPEVGALSLKVFAFDLGLESLDLSFEHPVGGFPCRFVVFAPGHFVPATGSREEGKGDKEGEGHGGKRWPRDRYE